MALTAIGRDWQNVTIAAVSKVRIFKGPIYIGIRDTTDNDAGFKIGTEFLADAGSVYAFRGPGYIDIQPYVEARLPAAFVAGNWTATAGVLAADITISALPALNGGTIKRIDYRVGNGQWIDSGRTTAGTFTISPLTVGAKAIQLRVVTSLGSGPASDVKSVTPTAS